MDKKTKLPLLCFLFIDLSQNHIYVGLLSSYGALKLVHSSGCRGNSPSCFHNMLRYLGTVCRSGKNASLKEADFFFQLCNLFDQGFHFLFLCSFFLGEKRY